ncbi:MAG: NAD(P)-binding domain-containing protein [Gemmatimonadota bacterium]
MRIAVLGTGVVGRTIATALVGIGHSVCMGSRSRDNPTATEWRRTAGDRATVGDYEDAASRANIIFNCTAGIASLEALGQAGEENLEGKILIDVANPLDFSHGMPPTLSVCNTDSLGEQIQRAFPSALVVKALNTINCDVMVDPTRVPGDHHVFLSGDDPRAKAEVATLLNWAFGWPMTNIIDMGDISTARGTEMMVPAWISLRGALGTSDINFHIAGAPTRPVGFVGQVGAVAELPPYS